MRVGLNSDDGHGSRKYRTQYYALFHNQANQMYQLYEGHAKLQ